MPRTKRTADTATFFRASPWQEKAQRRQEDPQLAGASAHVMAHFDLEDGSDGEGPGDAVTGDQARALEQYAAQLPAAELEAEAGSTSGQGYLIFYPTGELEGRAVAPGGESLSLLGRELAGPVECAWNPDWQLLRLAVFPSGGSCTALLAEKRGGDVARLSLLRPFSVEALELGPLLSECGSGRLEFDCEQHLDGARADAALRAMGLHHATGRDAMLNRGSFSWRIDAPRGLVAGKQSSGQVAGAAAPLQPRQRSQPKPAAPYDSDLDG